MLLCSQCDALHHCLALEQQVDLRACCTLERFLGDGIEVVRSETAGAGVYMFCASVHPAIQGKGMHLIAESLLWGGLAAVYHFWGCAGLGQAEAKQESKCEHTLHKTKRAVQKASTQKVSA